MRLTAGTPSRLGASWDGRGTNFALFSANAPHFRIASANRKCDLLAAAGVDFAVLEPFTPDLAAQDAFEGKFRLQPCQRALARR